MASKIKMILPHLVRGGGGVVGVRTWATWGIFGMLVVVLIGGGGGGGRTATAGSGG